MANFDPIPEDRMRMEALAMAVSKTDVTAERPQDVVERAKAYFGFMKGESSDG